MNANALFKKAAKATASVKKDATPEFQDASLEAAINLFLEGKKMEKTAKAQIKMAEVTLLPRATEARYETCRNEGEYFSSIKACVGDLKVTVSFPNKYSKIPTDREDDLRGIFADRYDALFEEKTIASLSPMAMKDEEFIQTVIDAIGADKFALYFKVEQFIAPKSEYHEARAKDEDLSELHQQAYEAGLINPVKASVKAG
tara:strand:- start:99985 stop:100587 length:603 start_codon:yes stop_codon:yes gene_type:complete